MKILILNGPNLNLTGERETNIYGTVSFENYLDELRVIYPDIKILYFQSNVEGEIINIMQDVNNAFDAIILNAGAYTHTSIAIGDAVSSLKIPVIEVHITNIFSRESFRQTSYLAPYCKGVISGFGLESYTLAIEYLNN
ncbi:MAG TPA: type II 3-dehydroquinate dehydratase [Bacteroidales bacterium]|nr:type II 3-dehydroquinate dehydratase [Bacteroidales bacterium]